MGSELERLARALQDALGPIIARHIRSPADGGGLYNEDYETGVLAVLTELMEPSEGATEVGVAAHWPVSEFAEGPLTNGERIRRALKAMIQHILSDGEGE